MVTVGVEHTDVRTHPCDVLAVGVGANGRGLDDVTAAALGGLRLAALPPAGTISVLNARPALAARHLLLVGVPGERDRSTDVLRTFFAHALEGAAEWAPDARDVCLVLPHGALWAADPAALAAEMERLDDLVGTVEVGPALRAVTVLLPDAAAAARVNEELRPQTPPDPDPPRRRTVFVAMPFEGSFDPVFIYGLKKPIDELGLEAVRMDKEYYTGSVVDRMKERIRESTLVVADLTGDNANVYLEVGYAWGLERDVLAICRADHQPKFDAAGTRRLVYEYANDLEPQVKDAVRAIVIDGQSR